MMGALDDRAAVFAFLVMAERERLMLNGRNAKDVLEAAARLCGYDEVALDKIRKLW